MTSEDSTENTYQSEDGQWKPGFGDISLAVFVVASSAIASFLLSRGLVFFGSITVMTVVLVAIQYRRGVVADES